MCIIVSSSKILSVVYEKINFFFNVLAVWCFILEIVYVHSCSQNCSFTIQDLVFLYDISYTYLSHSILNCVYSNECYFNFNILNWGCGVSFWYKNILLTFTKMPAFHVYRLYVIRCVSYTRCRPRLFDLHSYGSDRSL